MRLVALGLLTIASLFIASLFVRVTELSPASAVGPNPSVGIESASIPLGKAGTLGLDGQKFDDGLSLWGVDVSYDPEIVTLSSCEPAAGIGVCNAQYGPETARLVGFVGDGPELVGEMFFGSFTFECNEVGVSPVTLAPGVFARGDNDNVKRINPDLVNGSIACLLIGDADCDGEIDVLDALTVLQFAAGLTLVLRCPELADSDGDGMFGPTDALVILQFVGDLILTLPPGS